MLRGIVLFSLLLPPVLSWSQEGITIQWKNGKAVSIIISSKNLEHYSQSPDSALLLKVYLNGQEDVAVIGTTAFTSEYIRFTPAWPFSAGMEYTVKWRDESIGKITIPPPEGTAPVVRVYPEKDTLPENLLKAYFEFSQPMSEGRSYQYFHLLNANGDTLRHVFLPLEPELWNEDQTRLTVWLDPGRIKRDLLLNRELGKPLTKGENYTLVVSAGWRDKNGVPAENIFRKNFYVTGADQIKPNPLSWSLSTPQPGTREPLIIDFQESLDHSLIRDAIRVVRNKIPVEGDVQVAGREQKWIFNPDVPWQTGNYLIFIENRLEDLAGNNIVRLFDKDLQEENPPVPTNEHFILRFKIN